MTEERLKEIEEIEMSGQLHNGSFAEILSNGVCDIIKECHEEIRRCWAIAADADRGLKGALADRGRFVKKPLDTSGG